MQNMLLKGFVRAENEMNTHQTFLTWTPRLNVSTGFIIYSHSKCFP